MPAVINAPFPEGAVGVCKVRFNEGGSLRVPWGYVGGVQCDPVEKKPFFHVYPGRSRTASDARLRSALRLLPELGDVAGAARSACGGAAARRSPQSLVQDALRSGARVVVTPTTSRSSPSNGHGDLQGGASAGSRPRFVSNGNGTPRVLEYLRPHIDAYKVDLKSFDDRRYRELGGGSTDSRHHQMAARDGVWVEIVTLLIRASTTARRRSRADRVHRRRVA
jgi:pyruvate formate lyase activating enzyme